MILLAAACTLPPLDTPKPTPEPTPEATPEPTPVPTPEAAPGETPEPTPDPGSVPLFRPGEVAATTTDGLRLRRLPGTERQIVVQRLPSGAELVVEMGPIHVDGFGWYLVTKLDPDDPARGWIAAGYDPDPFLVATTTQPEVNPYIAGFAHSGDGEFGPVTIEDANYGLRWMALDPDGRGCVFRVFLNTPTGEPVQAVAVTVGTSPAPGEIGSEFFASQPQLIGPIFVSVQTDCTWAVTFVRFIG